MTTIPTPPDEIERRVRLYEDRGLMRIDAEMIVAAQDARQRTPLPSPSSVDTAEAPNPETPTCQDCQAECELGESRCYVCRAWQRHWRGL